jgi:hypothetical protein
MPARTDEEWLRFETDAYFGADVELDDLDRLIAPEMGTFARAVRHERSKEIAARLRNRGSVHPEVLKAFAELADEIETEV